MWYTTHRTRRLPNQGCREELAFSPTNEHGDQDRFYTTMNLPTLIKSSALAFSLVHSFVYVQVFDVVKRQQNTTMLRIFNNDDIWYVWISMESLDRKSLRKIFTLLSGTDIELRSPEDFCDRDERSDLNRTQWQEHHGRRQDQRRLIFVNNHLSVYDNLALISFIPYLQVGMECSKLRYKFGSPTGTITWYFSKELLRRTNVVVVVVRSTMLITKSVNSTCSLAP